MRAKDGGRRKSDGLFGGKRLTFMESKILDRSERADNLERKKARAQKRIEDLDDALMAKKKEERRRIMKEKELALNDFLDFRNAPKQKRQILNTKIRLLETQADDEKDEVRV